jgi:hypothetical protein
VAAKGFDLRRLRHGEILAGLGAVALVVLLFVLPWYGTSHGGGTDGWSAMPILRWLVVLAAVSGLMLALLQAACSSPALPVTASVIATVLGGLSTLVLVVRVFTGSGDPKLAAFLGLAASAALTSGGWMSMRQEGGWTPGPDRSIPTVSLAPPERS